MRMRLVAAALVVVALAAALVRTGRAASGDDAARSVVAEVGAATAAFRAATEATGADQRKAAFLHAAELYDAALAGGPRNGALLYNAGNARFLAGDVGRAILLYRRALLVRPGDPRIEANLDTARSRRRDRFDETSTSALRDTLLFWHRGLSLRSKVPAGLGAWALGFALLAAAVWLPRDRPGRRGALRTGTALVVVALVLGISAVIEMRDRAAHDAAVVVADQIALRTGDGASYPERYENPVHAGAEVRVVEERAGWIDVELPDGKRGWVPSDAVERV